MKKLFLLVSLLIFGLSVTNAQEKWVTQKIDETVSLKFPSEPKEVNPGSFVAASKDKETICIFSIINTSQFGYDSTGFAAIKRTDEFAKNFKIGIQQSLTDFNLDDIKIGTWNDLTSYTIAGANSKGTKIDYFMFVIGSKIYTLITRRADGIGIKDRDAFFASVELKH